MGSARSRYSHMLADRFVQSVRCPSVDGMSAALMDAGRPDVQMVLCADITDAPPEPGASMTLADLVRRPGARGPLPVTPDSILGWDVESSERWE